RLLQTLSEEHRALQVFIPGIEPSWRWIAAEDFPLYRAAFARSDADDSSAISYQRIMITAADQDELRSVMDYLPREILDQDYPQVDAQKKILERYLFHHAVSDLRQIVLRYPFDEAFIQQVLKELETKGSFVELPAAIPGAAKRWAMTEIVQRMRRLTLRRQRAQIQPCDATQFVNFLLQWQHRSTGARLQGSEGLSALMEKMQGLSLPADLWESEILARRIESYHPAWLDELCRQGEILWYGSNAGHATLGKLAFAFREDASYFRSLMADAMLINKEESKLTAGANSEEKPILQSQSEEILDLMRKALAKIGACFVSDLALETGLAPSTCAGALWELIWRGEVTNDTFAVIRAGRPPLPLQQPMAIRSARDLHQRYGRIYRHRSVPGAGRWSLLPPLLSLDELFRSDVIEMLSRQLLLRYGMLCREIYELERWPIPWKMMVETMGRLEWRGEVRRGYFVKGFSGMQFALPEAADRLLSYHLKQPGYASAGDQLILINTCDPANLYGAASPLPLLLPSHPDWRLLRHPNNYLVVKNGRPLLAIEGQGARLQPLYDLQLAELEAALAVLPQLLDDPVGARRIRSIRVESWDQQPIRNSAIREQLQALGFRDEFKTMVLEKNFESSIEHG
ncbi:MAG: hypothetical protein ONB11_08025, partial [candidate division KSB1 bacterium]|nr:hypothetical protein [candidate division KSB1 bacterium]